MKSNLDLREVAYDPLGIRLGAPNSDDRNVLKPRVAQPAVPLITTVPRKDPASGSCGARLLNETTVELYQLQTVSQTTNNIPQLEKV